VLTRDAEQARVAAVNLIWADLACQRPTDNPHVIELMAATSHMAAMSLGWATVIREHGADRELIATAREYLSRLQRGLILLGAVQTRYTKAAAALSASLEIVEAAEALMQPPDGTA
jgi:hypothetical protein